MLLYSGASEIGFADTETHVNEDFVHVKEFQTDEGIVTFGVVADGAGSLGQSAKYQPAVLAAIQVEEALQRLCEDNISEFLLCPHVFMREAMVSASYTLGAFRMCDEQHYSRFATSMSCVLFYQDSFAFAHTGNTRITLIRRNKNNPEMSDIKLITRDMTKGMELVKAGKISFNDYHLHPARLEVTGGLGLTVTPDIQVMTAKLHPQDIIILTSDGIHDAIRPDAMFEFLKRSQTCDDAVQTFIAAAKAEKYEDNMTALIFWNEGGAKK